MLKKILSIGAVLALTLVSAVGITAPMRASADEVTQLESIDFTQSEVKIIKGSQSSFSGYTIYANGGDVTVDASRGLYLHGSGCIAFEVSESDVTLKLNQSGARKYTFGRDVELESYEYNAENYASFSELIDERTISSGVSSVTYTLDKGRYKLAYCDSSAFYIQGIEVVYPGDDSTPTVKPEDNDGNKVQDAIDDGFDKLGFVGISPGAQICIVLAVIGVIILIVKK